MIWFWLAFFGLVALLLFLDLGVIHRKAHEQSLRSAAAWTVGWIALGLSFSGIVYLMYENHWLGIIGPNGGDAAVTYISAYLLEQALSVDNIFVIALTFRAFRVPMRYQHRILFWGIMGAIGFRLTMLGGGVWLANRFSWIFYVFGAYLAWQGAKLLRGGEEDEAIDPPGVKTLRKFVKVIDGDHGGKFSLRVNGRFALTTIAVCLIAIELQDIIFALDSIPAVLSVSNQAFIIITSNIFAIMGLRSLYFVLAGMIDKFHYLKLALGVLLIGIGLKMIGHTSNWFHISHTISLIGIASIIATGVLASMLFTKKDPPSGPGPTSPSP